MSAPENIAPSKLARAAEQVLADAEFPALSRQITDILEVLKDEDAPARRLAHVVMQDYGLTLKVLRLANSYHYNRSSVPTESVSHAIVLLGVHTVRALAGTLLLFEHYKKRSPELKQLLLLSMLTAHHARATSELLKLDINEEAYLCGMFRNLGEVLVASHFPAEYKRILAEEESGRAQPHACFRILFFHFEDLATEIAKHWQLPPLLFRDLGRQERPANDLQAVVAFSHELTMLLYRKHVADPRTRMHLLMLRYNAWLMLNRDKLGEVVDLAVSRTATMFKSLGMSLDELKLRKRIASTLSDDEATAEDGQSGDAMADALDEAELEGQALEADTSSAAAAADAGNAAVSFEDLAAAVDRQLESFDGSRLNELIQAALESVVALNVFDRVLFAQITADRKELTAKYSAGEASAALARNFRYHLSLRGGPIALATMRQQDLLVRRDRNPSAGEVAVCDQLGAACFAVFPVVGERDPIGCLFVDSTGQRPYGGAATEAALKRVRDQIGKALSLAARLGNRVWTADAKAVVIARLLRGDDPGVVSRETRIPVRTLDQWKREFLEAAPAAPRPDDAGRFAS